MGQGRGKVGSRQGGGRVRARVEGREHGRNREDGRRRGGRRVKGRDWNKGRGGGRRGNGKGGNNGGIGGWGFGRLRGWVEGVGREEILAVRFGFGRDGREFGRSLDGGWVRDSYI